MRPTAARISLQEWSSATPESDEHLRGVFLPSDAAVRALVRDLGQREILSVAELRDGLEVQTSSYVGRVRFGEVEISIRPKIAGLPLLRLLRYAYGLRDLHTYAPVGYLTESDSFLDLILHQLAAEAQELVSRGLYRRYSRLSEALALPRGRIDLGRFVIEGGVVRAALPCIYYPRIEDTLLNRTLLAGLNLATAFAGDLDLKRRLKRLAVTINENVAAVPLDRDLIGRATAQVNRLTRAYEPALKLIDMLVSSVGINLDDGKADLHLSGFLFDMNRFFQALLSRFLHEYLVGYELQDEFRLRGMMTYMPGFNPKGRRSPQPRPDYVVKKDSAVVTILDAKYVDLWARDLGRDILYQLSIYALSQKPGMRAVILHPSAEGPRAESRIELREPAYGGRRGEIVVRAVDLGRLEELVSGSQTLGFQQLRRQFAKQLVFGDATADITNGTSLTGPSRPMAFYYPMSPR